MIVAFLIISIFLVFVSTIGKSKTFIIFFGLCLIGCQFSISGPVTIEDILILFFAAFCFTDKNIAKRLKGYPFWVCLGLYAFSTAISSFFTKVSPHYGMAFVDILRITILPLLFYYYVRKKEDLRFLIKLICIVSLLGIILSIFALLFEENFYLNFIRSVFGESIGWDRIEQVRYGFGRVQGFCLQPVSYGYICTLLLAVCLLFLDKYKSKIEMSTKMMLAVTLSCVLGCLLSGSRSGILPMGLCLLYYYGLKATSIRNVSMAIILMVVVYFVYGSAIDNVWNSIFNSDEDRIGSSSEMRLNQLDISMFYFAQSPLIGMGTNAIFDMVSNKMNEAIHGGESVWFGLLINKGLLGITAYIFLYIFSFLHIRSLKFDALMFLGLQLMINTLTSIPGYDSSIFLCFVLMARRMYDLFGKGSASRINNIKQLLAELKCNNH